MVSKVKSIYSNSIIFIVFFIIVQMSIPWLTAQIEDAEKALFRSLEERFEQAKKNQVNFYSAQNYESAFRLYKSAKADFKAGDKISVIKQKINQATEYLNRAFKAAEISRGLLVDLEKIRSKIIEWGVNRDAPQEFGKSEYHFKQVIYKTEEGDIKTARIEIEKADEQYRLATVKWLKDGVLEKARSDLKARRKKIGPEIYKRNLDDLERLTKIVDFSIREKFDPLKLRDDVLEKINGILESIYPPFFKYLPDTLLIGNFVLTVETYTNQGEWDFDQKQAVHVSGTAWISFHCGLGFIPYIPRGDLETKNVFQVEPVMANLITQNNLPEASLIHPDIKGRQNLQLELKVKQNESQFILEPEEDLRENLRQEEKKGDILVHFDNVTIKEVAGRTGEGRIIEGSAAYPTDPPDPEIIRLSVDGFTVLIDTLTLSPTEAAANINLQFPTSIASKSTCEPGLLNLGRTAITPNCEFYVENLNEHFGPWIVGDTGMFIEGTGCIVDFSASQSPPSKSASWKGVMLVNGTASGKDLVSENSNTGYLTGSYAFSEAVVTGSGFAGQLRLSEEHAFFPTNPMGYSLIVEDGTLDVSESRIVSGKFGPGRIELPSIAICKNGNPGDSFETRFSALTVQDDLALAGEVTFAKGKQIGWGELTHTPEVVAWVGEVQNAYLYLPAGPVCAFSPVTETDGDFMEFSLSDSLERAVEMLKSQGMAGITIGDLNKIKIYSADLPRTPLVMEKINSWLHVGSCGVDGEIKVNLREDRSEDFGNTSRDGYVGTTPFRTTLSTNLPLEEPQPEEIPKERFMFFQFAASAVYDSEIDGFLNIPEPCRIKLPFKDMETTSTANLVGGNIKIPSGTQLEYWRLGFESTGENQKQDGVVSVRTGRLVFTAAGISEYKHFARPFLLTWCEMRADGNIGELFLDYNSSMQRFDGLPFSAHHLALSNYIPGAEDAYLAVCGTVHFNFFGSRFVNIHDARYNNPNYPFYSRYVTVPKGGEEYCKQTVTNLDLYKEWGKDAVGNNLVVFNFQDKNMDYNISEQNGFRGNGTINISFIPPSLAADIKVKSEAISIFFEGQAGYDLSFNHLPKLGALSEIRGEIQITGPQMERVTLRGSLSLSAEDWILASESGAAVEISITPTSCTFTAEGNMLLRIAGSSAIIRNPQTGVTAQARLTVDFSRNSAEGDVVGMYNCDSVLGGLEGNGQLTWYVDSSTQYLQGRVKIAVCSWPVEGGLEGGLFIGHRVPITRAWVLPIGEENFGLSAEDFNNRSNQGITGLYGYGQISFNWNIVEIFDGGIDLYAGMGAFSRDSLKEGSYLSWPNVSGIGLPCILGRSMIHVYGDILGGFVSASAKGILNLQGPPPSFEGTIALRGCVLWQCVSINLTAGINERENGFYIKR